jgi:hypothetical protein
LEKKKCRSVFCLWAGTSQQVVHAFCQQKWRNENNMKERKEEEEEEEEEECNERHT